MSCLLIQSQIHASQIYGKGLIFSENIKSNYTSQTYDNNSIFNENIEKFKENIERIREDIERRIREDIERFREDIKNNITLHRSNSSNNEKINTNTTLLKNNKNEYKHNIDAILLRNVQNKYQKNINTHLIKDGKNKYKDNIKTISLRNDQNKLNAQKEQIFRENVNNNTSLTGKAVNNVNKENINTILLKNDQDKQNIQNDQDAQIETHDEFNGNVIFNHGNRYKYPICNFNDYKIKCTDKSCIKISKWNTLEFVNSNIKIDTNKIECLGYINVNLVNTKLVINNNNDKNLNLLSEGKNIITLKNSELIFNNTDENNIIDLFYSDDSLPIINSNNSKIILNNVVLKLNNGYINVDDRSNFILNNSRIVFGQKGKININNSTSNFNKSLIELNSGKIKIDGNNSEFNLIDSHINSKKKQCILEISPCNKISLNNSLVNCLGKFKKIKTGNLSDAPLIDLKNKSIFSWRKMRCEYQDLNSIDETSAVILQEYYD